MWLKQSTVQVIPFGPFLDKGNGVDLEIGLLAALDHATTGVMLSKNGGTLAVREQGANFVASTYDAHGCYKVSLSAVDTGTLGRLRVIYTDPTTNLPVWQDFMVVPAQVWDSLVAGSDKIDVAVVEEANIDFQALKKLSLNAATPAGIQGTLQTLDALASAGITVEDILAGNLADNETFPAGSLGDRIRKFFWVLCNRMVINDSSGAFTAYKDDAVTPALTGIVVDDGQTTRRTPA